MGDFDPWPDRDRSVALPWAGGGARHAEGARMENDLTRAQHYRALATQMRETATNEPDEKRRQELLDLAAQYQRLADKLIATHQ